jgi:hypothetical protein
MIYDFQGGVEVGHQISVIAASPKKALSQLLLLLLLLQLHPGRLHLPHRHKHWGKNKESN